MNKTSDLTVLGQQIKSRRKKLGITQQSVADLSGTSVQLVIQVEGGKPTVRLDKLIAILHALGLQFKLEKGKQKLAIDESL